MMRLLFGLTVLSIAFAAPALAQNRGTNVSAVSTGFVDDCDSAAYRNANPAECRDRHGR